MVQEFGVPHAEALLEQLGDAGVQSLFSRVVTHMEELIPNVISSYVTALQETSTPY